MLLEHNIATLYDKSGKHNIDVEVNKKEEGQSYIEMSMRDDRGQKISAFIPILELYALTMAVVGEKEQDELMPVRQTRMTTFRRKHIVQLKKDMKKGEKITYYTDINIPTVVEEGLAGLVGKRAAAKAATDFLIPIN